MSLDRVPVRLALCDDCCCGTDRKHPGVDHAAIRDRLGAAARSAGGRSRTVGCLGVCQKSNVVVVRTARHDTYWVGDVLDDLIVDALATWIGDGAPTPVPPLVDLHLFTRYPDQPEPEPEPVAELVTLTTRPNR